MDNFELVKNAVGSRAKDIICQDLRVNANSNDVIRCPFPEHHDEKPSAQWKDGNHFYCYTCAKHYDIFNHYEMHLGIPSGEALKSLADEFNVILDSYEQPSLIRKRKVKPSNDYSSQISAVKVSEASADDYLGGKYINSELARFMGVSSDSENVYFNHLELVDGKWFYLNSKKRRLDGKDYEGFGKEINISGGVPCFFGLSTLFDKDGNYKKYVILTEGHTDALRVATQLTMENLFDFYGVVSLPNGASSMKSGLENSPTFNKWMARSDSTLILLPDVDVAGQFMVRHSVQYLDTDKVRKVDLTNFGLEFKEKRGDDISDLLEMDSALSIESILETQEFLPLEECLSIEQLPDFDLSIGFNPGFGTHYYNDRGFKGGCVTLITGVRGEGKTSIARQFLYSMFHQKIKSFAWFAESKGEDVLEMTKIHEYVKGGDCRLIPTQMQNGQTYFSPERESILSATKEMSRYLTFWDKSDQEEDAFNKILKIMKKAIKQGIKFFLIDNLMCLCASTSSKNVFELQKKIMMKFKELAKNNNIHIVMLAHPNAKNEKISGAMEVENLADTIIAYARCDYNTANAYISATNTQIAAQDIDKISAMLTYSKVRDGGTKSPLFIEWIPEYGVLREIAYLDKVINALGDSESIFTRKTKNGYM